MFGLSFWEIAIILAIALIVLGPSKLPDLAKSFGKSLREFRKATEDFKSTIDTENYREEPRREDPKPMIPNRATPAESIRPIDAVIEPSIPVAPAPASSSSTGSAPPDLTKTTP